MSCQILSRRIVSGLLLVSFVLIFGQPAVAQTVGDTDGNGWLDQMDVTAVEAAIASNSTQVGPSALSDVAHPCNGEIDLADLALIRRAARSSKDSLPIFSVCHGIQLGETKTPIHATLQPVTLDDQFLAIAERVPQFGGVYFETGGLPVVVLTDLDPAVFASATSELIDMFGFERFRTDEFSVVEGRYGFRELHSYRLASRSLFYLPTVVAIDTDEARNRLWIGLEDLDRLEEVTRELARIGIPKDAVVVEAIGALKNSQAGFDLFERPVVGGVLASVAGGGCSLGPIVRRGGVRGLLTNSHCSTAMGIVDQDQIHQDTVVGTSNLVGVEAVDAPLFSNDTVSSCPTEWTCQWADALYATVGMTAPTRRGAIRNSYSPASLPLKFVEAVELFPLCGDQVRKSGGATGRTDGTIVNTCIDTQGTGDGILTLCSYLTTAMSTFGDSGAPVYQTLYHGPAGANLYGMMFGSTDSMSAFSPISGIVASLGDMDFLSAQEPPMVTITSPGNNSSIGTGSSFPLTLTAAVSDFEDGAACSTCLVSWTSSADGFLGTVSAAGGVATLETELFGPGTRVLTATAVDSGGKSTVDQVTLNTGNAAPSVWIDEPAPGAVVPLGVGVTFSGGSYDAESFGQLACAALSWNSNLPGDPFDTGCSTVLTFSSLGLRTVSLSGIDSEGASAPSASQIVNVVPLPSTGPPIITFQQPPVNVLLDRKAPFHLQGYATDPDGQSPIQYEWVLKGPGLIGAANGELTIGVASGPNGFPIDVLWTPADSVIESCGGIVFDLELRASDADSEMSITSRQVTISGPLC